MRYSLFSGTTPCDRHLHDCCIAPGISQRPPQPLVVVRPLPNADAFELYQRLGITDGPSFLLESGNGTNATARYSFFGNHPYLTLTGRAQDYSIETDGHITTAHGYAFDAFRPGLRRFTIPQPDGCRRFTVGPSDTSVMISSDRLNHCPPWPLTTSGSPDLQWPSSIPWPQSITHRPAVPNVLPLRCHDFGLNRGKTASGRQ